MKPGNNRMLILGMLVAALVVLFSRVIYNEAIQPNTQSVAEGSFMTDISDPRKLVGVSHNVFIGYVVSNDGTHYRLSRIMPETLFSVEVLENLKGNFDGVIAVNQQGGVNSNGEGVEFEGDKQLQVGKTYLFATRHSSSKGWNTLIPTYGDILLESYPRRKGEVESDSINVEDADKVDLYRDAVDNEIPVLPSTE